MDKFCRNTVTFTLVTCTKSFLKATELGVTVSPNAACDMSTIPQSINFSTEIISTCMQKIKLIEEIYRSSSSTYEVWFWGSVYP